MYGECSDGVWLGDDWVEIHDGSSTQRYPRCGDDPKPSTVNGTTIIVKLYTGDAFTASGFLAVVTGGVSVTSSDVTCESWVGKCIIEVIITNFSFHHDIFATRYNNHHTTSCHHHHLQWHYQRLHLRPGQQTHQDCGRGWDWSERVSLAGLSQI